MKPIYRAQREMLITWISERPCLVVVMLVIFTSLLLGSLL
jgi:hypothetical protein